MSDIFISYAREDREQAKLLAETLAAEGWSVWWDRKIEIGRSFDVVIEQNLNAARCVIVMWTRNSINSEWVKTEAAEGARRKILIPVLMDDVLPPLEFRRKQAARLIGWDGARPYAEMERLLRDVADLLHRQDGSGMATAEPDENGGGGTRNNSHFVASSRNGHEGVAGRTGSPGRMVKPWLLVLMVVVGLTLATAWFFYMFDEPLMLSETLLVGGIYLSLVLMVRWIWARLRRKSFVA